MSIIIGRDEGVAVKDEGVAREWRREERRQLWRKNRGENEGCMRDTVIGYHDVSSGIVQRSDKGTRGDFEERK
jgi:hypothetical protein